MKDIVAANVAEIAKRHSSLEAAARHAKISPQQLRRIAAGTHAITLATVAQLSHGFGLPAYLLLTPGYDPANPVVNMTKEDAEKEIERRAKAKAAEILKEAADFYVDPQEDRSDGRSRGKPFGDLTAPHVQQKGRDAPLPAGRKAKAGKAPT